MANEIAKHLAALVGGALLYCIILWIAGPDKVLLRDVSKLTLHRGRKTTGTRSTVPQLKCVGRGAGCYKCVPQTVQCRNLGYDGYEVQWKCECDMHISCKFESIQVTCEGYDYPEDPYILKGSCGLEYTIKYTGAGESGDWGYNYPTSNNDDSEGDWFSVCVYLLSGFAIVFSIYKMCDGNGNWGSGDLGDYSDNSGDSSWGSSNATYGSSSSNSGTSWNATGYGGTSRR